MLELPLDILMQFHHLRPLRFLLQWSRPLYPRLRDKAGGAQSHLREPVDPLPPSIRILPTSQKWLVVIPCPQPVRPIPRSLHRTRPLCTRTAPVRHHIPLVPAHNKVKDIVETRWNIMNLG